MSADSLSSAVSVLATIFVLLPGFVALKIRQSTREYREAGTFELTITSVAYSVVILILWIALSAGLQKATGGCYHFTNYLTNLLTNGILSEIISKYTAGSAILYVGCFSAVALCIYSYQFMGLSYRVLKILGLNRFSEHLTPWEDFLNLNRLNWIAVELKDGRTILGKIGLFSYSPFEKQLVMTRTQNSPVSVYDDTRKLIRFGPEISESYVPFESIKSMHAIVDSRIEGKTFVKFDFLVSFALLGFATVAILFVFSLIALGVSDAVKCNIGAMIGEFIFTGALVVISLLSLRRFT